MLRVEEVPYTFAPKAPSVPAVPAPAPVAPPVVPAPPPVSAPPPVPRPATQPPPTPVAPKQTISDVAYTPKLTGPVDELRSMTIVDFRRLSKDPKEATLKIKDKIDLLGEQAFERKTDGVKAWQASEVNKTYLGMLRASLEGEPLTQVIAKAQAASQAVLTKDEFDAVMELNRDLRFG
jgi:hypothetical protein